MLMDRLKQIFSGAAPMDSPTDDGSRRAVAALLVHASRIDGDIDPAETAARNRLLQQKFDLADGDIAALVLEAEEADDAAVDLHRFTQAIKDTYAREQRGHIIEMLWEIVLADGAVDRHEANLVWRVAGLLGFTTRENVEFRQTVQVRLDGADE